MTDNEADREDNPLNVFIHVYYLLTDAWPYSVAVILNIKKKKKHVRLY